MRLKINMSTLIILFMIAYKFHRHGILHEPHRLCEQYEAIYFWNSTGKTYTFSEIHRFDAGLRGYKRLSFLQELRLIINSVQARYKCHSYSRSSQ